MNKRRLVCFYKHARSVINWNPLITSANTLREQLQEMSSVRKEVCVVSTYMYTMVFCKLWTFSIYAYKVYSAYYFASPINSPLPHVLSWHRYNRMPAVHVLWVWQIAWQRPNFSLPVHVIIALPPVISPVSDSRCENAVGRCEHVAELFFSNTAETVLSLRTLKPTV